MLMKHVGEAPRPLATLRPDVPPVLAAAIERALAKKPADRWPDAGTFRRALLDPQAGQSPSAPNGTRGESPTMAMPVASMPPAPMAPVLPPSSAPAAAPVTNVRDALADAMRRADRALADDGPAVGAATRPGSLARNGAAHPPAPAVPPVPPGPPRQTASDWRSAQRESEREWKEHLREQRREWKERQREQQEEWREYQRVGSPNGNLPAPLARGDVPGHAPLGGMPGALDIPRLSSSAFPPLSLEQRAAMFRRKAISSMVLLVFLTAVNAIHLFIPPWVLFPGFGIVRDLRRRWRPLRDEGLRFRELLFGGAESAVEGLRTRPERRVRTGPSLTRRAERFRRRVRMAPIFAVLGVGMAVIAEATGADPLYVFFALFMALAVLSLLGALRNGVTLRRAGLSLRTVLSAEWQEHVAAHEPARPRDEVLAEEAAALASRDVLDGPYGHALRGALDDRLVVRDTMAKLAPADRALIPDVRPTVDALVERIAGLVQSLTRVEGDVRPGQLESLGARLVQTRQEPAHAPDRDRKLALLERQQASLTDLAQRRATMLAQLESAQLVLQNVKLDLLKLRSAGVGALAEVTSATQEARALSRDIQYALDAADEVRAR